MPCFDNRDTPSYVRYERETACLNETIKKLEAYLCATLTFIETNNQLTELEKLTDWKEVGVTNHGFFTWWANHKEQDAKRKNKEALEAKKKEAIAKKVKKLKEKSYSSLTKEELQFIANNE